MSVKPASANRGQGDPEKIRYRRGDDGPEAVAMRRPPNERGRRRSGPRGTGIKVLGTSLVMLVAIATVAVGAQLTSSEQATAEQLVSPRVSQRGPVVNLTGIRPGGTRSSSFEVFNPNPESVSMRITGTLTGGSAMLWDSLSARVDALDTSESWLGPLGSLENASVTSHVLAGGATLPMRLSLSLPRSAGNDYQRLESKFSLAFSFTEPGKEGDSGLVEPPVEVKPPKDLLPPVSRITSRRPTRISRKSLTIRGTVLDADSGVKSVHLSLRRTIRKRGRKTVCQHWLPSKGRLVRRPRGNCVAVWFAAKLTKKPGGWQYVLPGRRLKKGKYSLIVRGTDKAGNVEQKFTTKQRNRLVFGLR